MESCIAHIVDATFRATCALSWPMENKPFAIVVLALIVLLALALWQFYSLAWGDVASMSYHGCTPSVAASPQFERKPASGRCHEIPGIPVRKSAKW